MRNYPRHVGTGPVLIEVGQGVVIGIEQVRCDIGSIAASENREVDHRERSSNVQTRGKSPVGRGAFYALNAHPTGRPQSDYRGKRMVLT
jgi:hypothetical protein